MLNTRAESKTYGATAILLTFLAMFIVFLVLAPPEYIEEMNLTYTPHYSSNVLLETPGQLQISGDSQESDTSTYEIGTVLVDNSPKTNEEFLMHQGVIRKSLLSTEILEYDFDINNLDEIDKIYFDANIIDKIGSGELIAKLNGVTIYSREVAKNHNLKLRLPFYKLKENNNTLKLTISSPGFVFWSTNAYILSDIYLIKEEYSKDNEESNMVFLDKPIVSDTKTAKFLSYVDKQGDDDASLDILLNNKLIYSGVPESNIEIQFPTAYLTSNTNQFTFRTSKDGRYELRYMYLHLKTVKYSKEEDIARYSFDLSEEQWEKAEDSDYECEILLRKTSGLDNAVVIDINNNVIRTTFDSNFTATEDICDYLHEEDNVLEIIPEDKVVLDFLELNIENK